MRLSEEEPERLPAINIVPMIDVIFAILAFFIVSTLFLTRSEGLPVNLPQAATAQLQRKAQITVTIQADGAIALNQTPVALAGLESSIQSLLEPRSGNIVILRADERVPHGQVVMVMDRLRQVEGVNLAIAIERPRAGS